EGPLSVNYGSKAIGGTINIITKKSKRQGIEANARALYQSIGHYNVSLNTSFFKKRHRFGINFGRNYFDGWSPGDNFFSYPQQLPADTNRAKLWNQKEQLQGEIFYDYIYNKGTISASGRSFYEYILNRGFPNAPYFETAFDDRYKTYRNDLRLLWNHRLSNKINLSNSLSYNRFDRVKTTEFIDLTTLNSVLSEAADAQDTSTFSLINWRGSITHTLSKRWSYLVGTDFIYETASGKRITDGVREIMDLGIYANLTYKITDQFSIKPGARYSYNSIYPSPITPSLGLLWRGKNIAIRGSVASGYRAPSLKELYFEFVDINHNIIGNEDLLPESSINVLGSIKYNKTFNSQLNFSAGLTGFYNQIQNQISLANAGDGQFTYFNIGEYRATGVQTEFTLSNRQFRSSLNVNYTGRYNRLEEDSDLIPTFNFTTDLSLQGTWYLFKGRYNLSIFCRYNGALETFGITTEEEVINQRQEAFTLLDISFTANLLKDKNLALTLGAKNLLNVTNVNSTIQSGSAHSSGSALIAGNGTSVFISLTYSFKHFKGNE
ncbi:MAG: TonB-dependent receptor, partial [Crocinitomicaceae bacterium]|nr:TonB-dependent receptor [Crocinitomicaceae bacterium]